MLYRPVLRPTKFWSASFDFARVNNPSLSEVLLAADRCGGFAGPCHPGCKNVGLFAHYDRKAAVGTVHTVEVLNGGSIPGEDELSVEEAGEYGYLDPDHEDFQAHPNFTTHCLSGRVLSKDFPQIGGKRGIDGGKAVETHWRARH